MHRTRRLVSLALFCFVAGCQAPAAEVTTPAKGPATKGPPSTEVDGSQRPTAAESLRAGAAAPSAAATSAVVSLVAANAGQAERSSKPLNIDDDTPFGVRARDFVDIIEGQYGAEWPASSGLGSVELTVDYNGGALALSTSTALVATPNDRDMDGVADGSVYIVVPVELRLVTAQGTLVVESSALSVFAGPARAAAVRFMVSFDALTPAFDPASIESPESSDCGLGYFNLAWDGAELVRMDLTPTNARSGVYSGTLVANQLTRR